MYHIVVGSWEIGVQWVALVDRRSRWVALFVWACILHISFWLAYIFVVGSVVSFGRWIQIVFSCTPFANLWWIVRGLVWVARYKQRRRDQAILLADQINEEERKA